MGCAGLAALLSASCCALPIGLSIIGLGGAWLSVLEPFVAYRSRILSAVAVVPAWDWYRLARTLRRGASMRGAAALATFATLSFLAALTSPPWEEEVAGLLQERDELTGGVRGDDDLVPVNEPSLALPVEPGG